jgi:G3E family GTPase
MERTIEPAAIQAIPVSVITGFLGSGKTTLLNHLLSHPAMGETAVLINEFGEIGLDHLLVRQISEDIVLLNSGCLCCTVRGDLVDSLRELFLKRGRGEVPEFRRTVVETTGLADPAPIIHTLMTDPVLGKRYRLDGIVTTVDAVLGSAQLDTHPEPIKQAAVADRLVLTKTDIATDAAVDALRARLGAINPSAPVIVAVNGAAEPDALFDCGLFDPKTKVPDVAGWLNEEAYAEAGGHHHPHDVNRHDDRISAFCMTIDAPIEWDAFAQWLEMLLATRGENLLRIKGILNVAGEAKPVAIHGVQHVFHPPATLSQWPDEERRSRIVFITRDLGRQAIEDTFRAVYGYHAEGTT